MGLDMYLYKAKKVNKETISEIDGMTSVDIVELYPNIVIFNVDSHYEDDDEYSEMLRDILPYCKMITVVNEYLDIEKIRKDNGIPDNWIRSGSSYSSVSYTFWFYDKNGEERKEITVTREEIDTKYTIAKREDAYIVKLIQVGYWRKQYDLQELLHEHYDGDIHNCGYHRLNEEMYDDIQRYRKAEWGGLDKKIRPEQKLFYHEWY